MEKPFPKGGRRPKPAAPRSDAQGVRGKYVPITDVEVEPSGYDIRVQAQLEAAVPATTTRDCASAGKCWSCGDFGNIRECTTGMTGCLGDPDDPAVAPTEFVCPPCLKKEGRPVQYEVQGYGGCAPVHGNRLPQLFYLCLRLGLEDTDWAGEVVHQFLQAAYRSSYSECMRIDMIMSKGRMRTRQIAQKMRPVTNWISEHPTPDIDFFALVDSHTDGDTGYIAYSHDAHEVFECVPIDELLAAYTSDLCRQLLSGLNGLRGMALLTCGETWTNEGHYSRIWRGQLDFVVGFTGKTVLSHIVVPSLMDFVSSAYLKIGRPRLLAAFFDAFANKPDPLSYTPAILVRREPGGVVATEVRHSQVAQRVWGIRPPTCPVLPCMGHNTELSPRMSKHDRRHERCYYVCQVCHGRSDYIRLPSRLRRVPGYDFSFHHTFGLHDSIRAEIQYRVGATWQYGRKEEAEVGQAQVCPSKKRRTEGPNGEAHGGPR
ncbi:hypothetical protein BOTBODRAFT_182181 [Botryobasidium botryosum FD-172 SS1]|uniref:Uncharacterized protein n=1 Tax=Botryobasidium botryosum (strain FD-172 SS1) TaxID=930990 RepID=A0A067LS60_BOTB1|nr:hypothetical protein BOTBODRAFT_182181 [Botryobasidium botryosum FD-172 SS1]